MCCFQAEHVAKVLVSYQHDTCGPLTRTVECRARRGAPVVAALFLRTTGCRYNRSCREVPWSYLEYRVRTALRCEGYDRYTLHYQSGNVLSLCLVRNGLRGAYVWI